MLTDRDKLQMGQAAYAVDDNSLSTAVIFLIGSPDIQLDIDDRTLPFSLLDDDDFRLLETLLVPLPLGLFSEAIDPFTIVDPNCTQISRAPLNRRIVSPN